MGALLLQLNVYVAEDEMAPWSFCAITPIVFWPLVEYVRLALCVTPEFTKPDAGTYWSTVPSLSQSMPYLSLWPLGSVEENESEKAVPIAQEPADTVGLAGPSVAGTTVMGHEIDWAGTSRTNSVVWCRCRCAGHAWAGQIPISRR